MNRPGHILADKKAVVTGGAQGLGEAICHRLAVEGCDLVIGDINEEGATATAHAVQELSGREVRAVGVDVTKEEDVQNLFGVASDRMGRVDIVVSNAAILIAGAIDTFPLKGWRHVMEVNLIGYFLTTKYAAAIMKEQQSGSIIQINSKSGKKGSAKNSAYSAGKFGGIGHTQSVALELAEYGIRCNAICPGNLLDSPLWVNSLYQQYAKNQGITEEEVREKYINQVPMKRGCEYNDVCNLVVFLASDQSVYMTGQAINVTGGQEMR